MWAALLAGNLSVLLQALTELDTGPHGRAHAARLRHELLRVQGGSLQAEPPPEGHRDALSASRLLPLPQGLPACGGRRR